MNTSAEAANRLQQAIAATQQAHGVIENLIAEHDYQDVAALLTQAAGSLLQSAALLMQSQDEAALEHLETAEDFLDAVYDIIDAEMDED